MGKKAEFFKKTLPIAVVALIFVISLLCCLSSVNAESFKSEEAVKGAIYVGVWAPVDVSTNKFDDAIRNVDFNNYQLSKGQRLTDSIRSEIKKHSVIERKLDLVFPEKGDTPDNRDSSLSKMLTFILSRATHAVNQYEYNGQNFYQNFFTVTLSLVVVNPKTKAIDYSRILTGELPVLETRPFDQKTKQKHFADVIQKTLSALIEKTAFEFQENNAENPDFYFQATHLEIKPDASILLQYERDLMQFLHDALIARARQNGLKVYFIPPESKWNSEMWNQFIMHYRDSVSSAETLSLRNVSKEMAEGGQLLTIWTSLQKTNKSVIKENKLEAYLGYNAYTAGAVVLRNEKGEKVAVYPKNEKNKIVRGTGVVQFHDVKGTTVAASEEHNYLNASQQSFADLSKYLIFMCDKAYKERLKGE